MSYFGIPVRNGLPIGLGSVAPLASSTSSPFSPASFFANGEQGWWYDPSNFATLFQDAAGTTPVTAVEQPVGLQLDLSGRGNHRRQSTSANRPVVSARVNLLTKTEQFNDAAWSKTNTTATAGLVSETTSTGEHNVIQAVSTNCNVFSVELKENGRDYIRLFAGTSTATSSVTYRFSTNTFSGIGTEVTVATPEILSDGYVRLIVTSSVGRTQIRVMLLEGSGTTSYAGDITKGVFVRKADFRPTNQGVDLPAYQRVNTSTDYDSTGFPTYIKPNGSNQFMVTNSINFTATDKMTVWQGVGRPVDTAGMIIELSASAFSNANTFNLVPGNNALALTGPGFGGVSRGTGGSGGGDLSYAYSLANYAPPVTAVVSALYNIAGDTKTIRANGASGVTNTADQGTGNYGTYPAYFYMRAGTSLPFNGHDYGSIARGAASTAAQITAGETYINSLTKAY